VHSPGEVTLPSPAAQSARAPWLAMTRAGPHAVTPSSTVRMAAIPPFLRQGQTRRKKVFPAGGQTRRKKVFPAGGQRSVASRVDRSRAIAAKSALIFDALKSPPPQQRWLARLSP